MPTNQHVKDYLSLWMDLNGGNVDDAEIVWDPAPGPQWAHIAAVRIPGHIDYLVYFDADVPEAQDAEEVTFKTWPPRSNYP